MCRIQYGTNATEICEGNVNILKGVEGIGWVEFNKKDIVRHKLVQKIVEAYDKYENKLKNETVPLEKKTEKRK